MAGDLLPYLKFYPAETLADERFATWDLEARGAWLTLILHAWVNGSIPSDLPSLARVLRVNPRAMDRIWSAVGDRFVPHSPGRLTSERLELERNDARTKSEAGRNGARTRWEKERNPAKPQETTDAVALPGAMPAAQNRAEQNNAEQIPPTPPPERGAARAARLGVGHPAFEVIQHWTQAVWPRLSPDACAPVTTAMAQRLAALAGRITPAEVMARMDRAASDPWWRDKLTLEVVLDNPERFAERIPAPAGPPRRNVGAEVDARQEAARAWAEKGTA